MLGIRVSIFIHVTFEYHHLILRSILFFLETDSWMKLREAI